MPLNSLSNAALKSKFSDTASHFDWVIYCAHCHLDRISNQFKTNPYCIAKPNIIQACRL